MRKFILLILFQVILLVAAYPAENDDDTPIKKIVIRPTSRSDFIQAKQHHRGRKIENEPTIIKVLKKPAIKSIALNHPKKYDSKVHILSNGDDNSIHYAKAKVNGSFRNSPIRAINARKSRKLRPTNKSISK
ncbi:uncharacterized protein LOC129575758 [Sitodiplosis mosellana]|uniref:uncharacterized protein LOC129575758 n=1 Tax=Sitodiplosis mosellana TaxID=263140 RepID=UPI002444B696|nr:uncharacterized protein LOC129575758 [Sitodiplosis mosellana]